MRYSLISLVALLGSLAFATVASAQNIHVLTQTIAGNGAMALQSPRAIAVDSSNGPSAGDIYVADTGNRRIVKFDSAGNFLLMWGKEVNEGTGNPNICTNAGEPTDVCKAGGGGDGPGFTAFPSAIAVDSSSGPSAGDIYVSPDLGNASYIEKFDPSGHLVTGWGGSPFPGAINGSTAPGGPFSQGLNSLTVDQSGSLVVLAGHRVFTFAQDGSSPSSFSLPSGNLNTGLAIDASGNFSTIYGFSSQAEAQTIEKVGPTGTDIGRVDNDAPQYAGYTGLASDPVHNDLFGIINTPNGTELRFYHFNGAGEVVQADSSTCIPAPSSGCTATENFGSEAQLAFNSSAIAVNNVSGKVYVGDNALSVIRVFSLINVPKVTTNTPSNVTRDSVIFKGHVDPDSAGNITSCKFEYGTTTSYGATAPCTPPSTTSAMEVTAQLPPESLEVETTYHYRLVAANANGTRTGNDQTFKTPMAVGGVTTGSATTVNRQTATVVGSFTGDGVDASYYFEYGPTTSYGQTTPDVDQGTGIGTQDVSANLAQLYAYTYYHYRLVAHNKYGKNVGADQIIQTLPPDVPLVESTFSSAVDQNSATVNAVINPGEGLTIYRFEYGLSGSYGSRTSPAGPIEPESSTHTASTELSELAPGTTYHFRVLATNVAGTTVGPDQTFTTPSAPFVVSSTATAIGRTSATLDATINPSLSLTTFHFDYGRSASYGLSTPESGPIGPDTATHAVSAALTSLAPGAEYHFRAVATNAVGTTYGTDQVFSTQTEPPSGGGGTECKKGFVLKHGKCVRKKHRKHPRRHHRHSGGGND